MPDYSKIIGRAFLDPDFHRDGVYSRVGKVERQNPPSLCNQQRPLVRNQANPKYEYRKINQYRNNLE
jgi:hypothetical protein